MKRFANMTILMCKGRIHLTSCQISEQEVDDNSKMVYNFISN